LPAPTQPSNINRLQAHTDNNSVKA
jgi:hypothetical protein